VSILHPRGIRTLNQITRNLVLLIVDGPKKGLKVIVPPGESRVVGRTTAAHVACEDDYMSSKHFEVCNRIENFFVRDLNSRNGTKVFDESISERSLTQTSKITAGKSTFEVAWESNHEEWGTQAGSSVSIRRGASSFSSQPGPARSFQPDSAYGSSPGGSHLGSQSQFESKLVPTNYAIYGSLEERVAVICLDLFHAVTNHRRDDSPAILERLYNWSRIPTPGESFLSDFYLSNLDFFAIASFSKLGVENPANIAWYPLYPAVDPASSISPVAIPKRAWLENCHTKWFDRLSSVDGISFVLTDSLTSPEWILNHLNRGFRDLLSPGTREESLGSASGVKSGGILPWYSPVELLSTIGTRTEESLAGWIPPAVQGLVFPIRSCRLSFAFVRPETGNALRERGFVSASDVP